LVDLVFIRLLMTGQNFLTETLPTERSLQMVVLLPLILVAYLVAVLVIPAQSKLLLSATVLVLTLLSMVQPSVLQLIMSKLHTPLAVLAH
jgi:hypothetical protein